MPGRSGDYDAGGMVWGSMIGKKLFGGSGLSSGPGLASGSTPRARGPPARARVRAQEAGRAGCEGELEIGRTVFRLDWSPVIAQSSVTISHCLWNNSKRAQPQNSQRTHKDFLGT
jgi:hypothetical protein